MQISMWYFDFFFLDTYVGGWNLRDSVIIYHREFEHKEYRKACSSACRHIKQYDC